MGEIMNVLTIMGTPHNGNTRALVDLFKDEFLRKEYQNLSEYKLYCITKSFNNQELMLKWIIYFAENNIMDFNSIYNIIRIIDKNEYIIQFDKKGIKPISYTRK